MGLRTSLSLLVACSVFSCQGFYKPQTYKDIPTHTPTTLDELKTLLCTRKKVMFVDVGCDSDPKKIIINKVFDFTNSEGAKTEPGCRYTPVAGWPSEQWTLDGRANACGDRPTEEVRYSVAALSGLEVGSNKIIVGRNGGGLKGKGLKLDKSSDVQIRNLAFTDINPHLHEGGSAVEMIGAKNVLVYGNYFKDIGGAMVASGAGGSATGVTVSANLFDGANGREGREGRHLAPVWRFAGESERIRLDHNTVRYTGDSPLAVDAHKSTKTVVHLLENVVHDVKHAGVIRVGGAESSVLVEGNVFANVTAVADRANRGALYMARSETDELACVAYVKRRCQANTVFDADDDAAALDNSLQTLRDIQAIYDADRKSWTDWWWK